MWVTMVSLCEGFLALRKAPTDAYENPRGDAPKCRC